MGVFLILWVVLEKQRYTLSLPKVEKIFMKCKICTFVYGIRRGEKMSRCPMCGSLNEVVVPEKQEGENLTEEGI